MQPLTVLAIAVPVLVGLAGALIFAAARRQDSRQATGVLQRETVARDRPADISPSPVARAKGREIEQAATRYWRPDARSLATLERREPVVWVPPDSETLGVTRRQFMNRGVVALFGLGLSGFAAASLGFLWPRAGGGFGGRIQVGKLSDIGARIDEGSGFLYVPEGRRDPDRAEHVEHVAARLIGVSFLLLAAFVAYEAIRSLALHQEPDASPLGIALTAISLVVMPLLARAKLRLAVALDSHAAQADSAQTRACAWLSAVVLTGLALNASLGWWWADPIAALGVVALLVREGHEALTAEHLDDCC